MPRVPPVKRDAVAALVRRMIADGTLKPGADVPFSTVLSKATGVGEGTCRRAVRKLVADGTLARGVSPGSRLRVARPGAGAGAGADRARENLSRALAGRRRAERLTQVELAALLGVPVTTVGHAETGRTWQGRPFWEDAARLLGGDLLDRYDACRAAVDEPEAAGEDEAPGEPGPVLPVLQVSVAITADGVLITWPGGAQTLARPPG
jgi:DNA-binding XRE family transcriptional regulator